MTTYVSSLSRLSQRQCLVSLLLVSLNFLASGPISAVAQNSLFCGDLECTLVLIGNGECDPQCLSLGCDYDGGDCCEASVCPKEQLGDGICNEECDSVSCGFDNGDCEFDGSEDRVLTNVNLVLIITGAVLLGVVMCCISLCQYCYGASSSAAGAEGAGDIENGDSVSAGNLVNGTTENSLRQKNTGVLG